MSGLSALCAGIGALVKSEATGYLFIYFVIFFIGMLIKKEAQTIGRFSQWLKFIFISLGILALFHICRNAVNLAPDNRLQWIWDGKFIYRTIQFGRSLWEVLFWDWSWNIVWLISLVSFLNYKKIAKNFEIQILLLALVMFFGYYLILNAVTNYFYVLGGSESYQVLSRVVLHFFPLAPLLIILLNFSDQTKTDSTHE